MKIARYLFMFVLVTGCIADAAWAEPTSENNERLKRGLKKYPDADANKDGVLTLTEARAFLKKNRASAPKKPQTPKGATETPPAGQTTEGPGYNCLFIGHSFFIPVARTFAPIPAKYGFTNHRQQLVMAGGPNGSVGRLWQARRADVENVLKTGKVDLLGMTYHQEDNSSYEQYKRFVDLALKYNPKTKFFIGLPWSSQPASRSLEDYTKSNHAGDKLLRARVSRLQKAYPQNQFIYANYGKASVTLKSLVETNKLPGVTKLKGRTKECLYRDELGHANPPLLHLAALVWVRTLYEADLNKTRIDSPVELDLRSHAMEIADRSKLPKQQSAAKAPAPKRRWQDQFFKSRDRNGDGFVTLEEFIGDPKNPNVPDLTKRYRQFDSNGDGKLLLEELKKQTQRQNPFADIGLSQKQQMQVQEFQRSMQAEMKKARESRDRKKIQAAHKKYWAGLAKILDEEQMKKYKAAIAKMREPRTAAPQPLGQSKRQSVVQSATDDQTATAKKRPVSAGTTSSQENLDLLFSDPPNEYRIVKYQLNNKTLVQYPQYGFGGYQPFFYGNLYRAGPTGPSTIGPLVDAAKAQGRTVWSADDVGYPSGSAGGKVVANNPEYEVRGVAMLTKTGSGQTRVSIATPPDCEKMVSAVLYPVANGVPDFSQGKVQSVQDTGVNTTGLTGDWQLCAFVLQIRDSNTQCADRASQFRTTGRYPDLLNPNAVASWISLMHEPILAQITDPASQLEGFYFNEPSLQQLNWHKTAYATLPWNAELFNKFQAMHGYALQPAMGALYEGDDLYAKRVRMHFHQTVGEMLRISFSGQLAEWCEKRGMVASGHPLLEEYLRMHVANYGDMLKVVSELQVPAMDLPMPEPGQMARHNFHFPKLFSSAGVWNEHDSRVIALLDPVIGGYGRNRKVPSEQALYIAVNGASRCGVNLFATYINTDRYGPKVAGIFKQLNEYTGRISVMLTGARIATPVALYYPIEMFQMEYKPTKETHRRNWSTPRQAAWDKLQTTMLDAEVDYNIVHPEWVRDAAIKGGELKIGSGSYRYLVMPNVEVISSKVLAKIKQFQAAGGTVLWVGGKPMAGAYPSEDAQVVRAVAGVSTVSAAQAPGLIPNPYDARFTLNVTSQDSLLTTRFRRQGRSIYFLANPTGSSITAHLDDVNGGLVKVYDPVTGKITRMPLPTDVVIDAYKSCTVISPADLAASLAKSHPTTFPATQPAEQVESHPNGSVDGEQSPSISVMYYAIGAVLLVTVVIVVLKARKKRQTDAPADPDVS
ncbi:MAG: hypothetical protein HN350_12035 [Phycisphaerales bacterium]|nr:hypothetical protein [Phycisphaerales bacterium]